MFHKNKMPEDLKHIMSALKYAIIALTVIGITTILCRNAISTEFAISKPGLAILLSPIAIISATLGLYAELNSTYPVSKIKLQIFLYELLYFTIGLFALSSLLLTIQPKLFHNSTQIMTTESTVLMALIGIQILFIQLYRLVIKEQLPNSAGLFIGIIPYGINIILLFTINAKSVYPQFDILGDTSLLMFIPAITSLLMLFAPTDDTKSKSNVASA